MPLNYVDVSTFDDPVVGPAGSDPKNRVTIQPALQSLCNRTRWLKDIKLDELEGFMAGHGSIFSVALDTIGWDGAQTIILASAGHWTAGSLGANSTPLVLVASTWYYVYAEWSSGPVINVSTTAPVQSGGCAVMTGDATQRYLTCFRTDTDKNIVPFRVRRGRYLYRWSGRTDYTFWNALAAGNAIALTSVPLKDSGGALELVPPHVRQVTIRAETSNGAGSIQGARILTFGDGGSGYQTVVPATSGLASEVFEIECDSSRRLKYLVTDAAVHLTLSVMGFQE